MTRLSQPLIALHSKKWFYLEEFYDRNYDGRKNADNGMEECSPSRAQQRLGTRVEPICLYPPIGFNKIMR